MKYSKNPDFFIKIINGKLILWDYRHHIQFELSIDHLRRIDGLSNGIYHFDKMWWKYPHSRAYRVVLLDIGCLTQTFQLVTTALGLDSWPTEYFLDRKINQLLDIDEINESVLFFLGAGHGTGSPISSEEIKILNRLTRKKDSRKL